MALLKQINDILGVFLATTILVLGIIENSSKIAKKPLSAIAKWLGIEKNKRIDEISKKLDDLNKKVDYNDIDTVRSRIVAFENLCRLNKDHKQIKKHQYLTIFKDIDKWTKYHKIYPDLNGEIDVAIQNIKDNYKSAIFS